MTTVGNHPSPAPSSPDVDEAIFRLKEIQRLTAKTKSENTASQRPYTNLSRTISSEMPFGKFAASTATFSWPSLKPLSQLEQPRMFRNPGKVSFVSYRQVSDPGAWSSSSGCTSPALSFCTTSESASLKRSLSQSEEDDGDSSDTSYDSEKQLGGIRIIRTRKELFHNDASKSPSPIAAADDVDVTPPSPAPRKRSTPRRTPPIITDLRSTPDLDQPDTSGQEVLPKTDWERFAAHIEKNDFACRWAGCKYLAKKQLVKRHIETTHMKLKPFACTFCSRRFPQKTSLNVHIASKHTRNNPYKCPFDGCKKAYNDPARLHRHKTDIHSYVPKATARCKKRSRVSPCTSDYEMVPFTMP